MKWLDIITRTAVFVIALVGIFYIIPMIIIPDVVKEFKKVFTKPSGQRIEVIAGYKGKKKKKLWDTRSTFNIKV